MERALLHAPTKERSHQTVFSTANAAIIDEATAFQKITILLTKSILTLLLRCTVSKLNNRFIEDMHFNVEKYLTNEFARRFGRAEEQVFINGTGANKL